MPIHDRMLFCCLRMGHCRVRPEVLYLTYRGTVTSGPYRFMRHPAYVSKVASYWLITMPFVPIYGWGIMLQQCLTLSVLSFIYYLRASYEERHLLNYPEYRSYVSGWTNCERGAPTPVFVASPSSPLTSASAL